MFSGLAPFRRLALARESPAWAFLSAAGAAFLVGAVVQLVTSVAYTFLFPPTRPPAPVSPRVVRDVATGVVAGMVAMRAGGVRAVAVYAGFEIALVAAQLPARVFSCEQSSSFGGFPIGFPSPCDYVAFATARWPFWLALATGVASARGLAVRDGSNLVLRAAGVLNAASAAANAAGFATVYSVALWQGAGRQPLQVLPNGLTSIQIGFIDLPMFTFALGEIIGGVLAGILLARARLAAPVLVALALVAPSFALGVPLWRSQIGAPPFEPIGLVITRFAWLWTPLLAAAALFIGRSVARRRDVPASH